MALIKDVNQQNDEMLDASHPQSQLQWQPLGTPLPSYEKGTDDVEGDQVAKLHDGEMVLNADEAEKYRQEHGAPTDFPGQVMQNPKGIKPQMDTDAPAPDYNLQGAQMHTENAPLGNPIMNRQNAPMTNAQPAAVQEASTKPSAGLPKIDVPKGSGATDSTRMSSLPTQQQAMDDQSRDAAAAQPQGTPAPLGQAANEASAKMANYPVQQEASAPTAEQGREGALVARGEGDDTRHPAETSAPDPMAIVQQDKLEAMKKGSAGLSDLGTSLIHEKALMPKYTGKGADEVAQGEQITPQDKKAFPALQHGELEHQKKDYDRRIQAAMGLGTPEGDREAASLQLAKQHLETMNPYGSAANHPGVLGKIEHGLAKAGNIAGDIVAPSTMAMIPGTDINKGAMADKYRGQEAAATKEGLEQAQTDKENTPAVVKPKLLTGDNDTRTGASGQREQAYEMPDGSKQWVPEGQAPGAAASAPAAGAPPTGAPAASPQYTYGNKPTDEVKQPVGPEGATRHDAELNTLTGGMSPADKKAFLSAYAVKPEDTLGVQTKRLEDAKASAQLSGNALDRQMAREQAQRNHEEAMARMAETKSKSESVKARQEVAKIYADPMLSSERYNIMTKNLSDALPEKEGGHNDQQAMLSLLANHLGMTMGLQKGARMNQAIINEAASSQPWLAKMGAKFDKDGYLTGLTLGPDQMRSMANLARERYREDVSKARNVAKYAGAEDDGPDRTASTSTMHYYLGLAGGDVNKAKQMADEDGWTIQKPKGK
jgi:hypothetical protein